MADIVRRTFGVLYHPDRLGRILHELGFTPQKPEQIAREYADLANFLPDDQSELRRSVYQSIKSQRTRKHLLRSFFHAAKIKL